MIYRDIRLMTVPILRPVVDKLGRRRLDRAMARLGPYELLRQVGTGGMGQVWLARRSMVGGATKNFAIKLLAPRHVASQRHRDMFLEEARLSMTLEHSNIVKVTEVGEFEGTCYMAMEWLDGLTLAQLNSRMRERKKALSPGLAGFIIGQVLRALAYAHEADHRGTKQPMVHRDVSPQNVMLTVTGDVKLLDFGIARFVSDDTSGLYVKGKPRYMAPEQFHGLSRAPIIDLFAVGALLHEMLDGGRVFRWQAGDARLLEMVAGGQVPELETRSVPAALDQLRRDLLAPEAKRLQSARAALARLSAWSDYRDASLSLQDMVRGLVPVMPALPPPKEPSAVEPFSDTLAAAIAATDEPIESIFARLDEDSLGDVGLSESEDPTREHPTSKPHPAAKPPPTPPPPPVVPERALEIDWIAAGQPKTGPNPIVTQQQASSRGPLLVLGIAVVAVIVVVVLALGG
jgi:serine/threonine protein kinase